MAHRPLLGKLVFAVNGSEFPKVKPLIDFGAPSDETRLKHGSK